jgi:hypothetical protein
MAAQHNRRGEKLLRERRENIEGHRTTFACHACHGMISCCRLSKGCSRLEIARVAADSALFPKPSASMA